MKTTNPREVTSAAQEVIGILTAAGWLDTEITSYFGHSQPGRDRVYEKAQLVEFGSVRITAAEMRAEIQRLLLAEVA